MEFEHCDICGRSCDGVHKDKTNDKNKLIENIVNILMSYDANIIDEVIKRIYENREQNM